MPVFAEKSVSRQNDETFSAGAISASDLENLKDEIRRGKLVETVQTLKGNGYSVIWLGWQSDGKTSNKIWALFHMNQNSRSNNGRAVAFGKPYGKLQVEYSAGKGKSNLLLIEEKRAAGYADLDLSRIFE